MSIEHSYDESISYSSDDLQSTDLNFSGVIVNDDFIIVTKLGSGAFATVWLAYNFETKDFVAIKIQNPEDTESGLEEVEILNSIIKSKCTYLNKMLDHFIWEFNDEKYVCMIFELLAGSLYDVIRRGKYSDGMEASMVKKIIYQVLIAIDSLNRELNILHTDIKPENILIEGRSKNIQEIIDEISKYSSEDKNKIKKVVDSLITNSSYESSSDCSSSHETNENYIPIDEEYLNNINIRLSDFGGCYEITENMNHEIQTRYYRAPEILLEYNFNETCDIWSVGCVMYELLTGSILFNPDKKLRFCRNRHHVYDIQSILGLIPKHLLEQAKKRNVFYRKNGMLKGIDKLKYMPLSEFIIDKLKNKNLDNGELFLMIDFFYKVFEYDPEKRLTARKCLEHEWFSDLQEEFN